MCSSCHFNPCQFIGEDRFSQFIGRRDFTTFREQRLRRLEEDRNDCFCNRRIPKCIHCKSCNQNSSQFLDIDDFIRLHEDRLRGVQRFEDELIRCVSFRSSC